MKGSGVVQATVNNWNKSCISGNVFKINNDTVLTADTLGTSVVTSSLTKVGILYRFNYDPTSEILM